MVDNPLAFPVATFGPAGDMIAEPGMTLRDWFAGQALMGRLFHGYNPNASDGSVNARAAYKIADAMLAERAKVQP